MMNKSLTRTDLIASLVRDLRANDSESRIQAATQLGLLRDAAATPSLIVALLQARVAGDTALQIAIVKALGSIADPDAQKALESILDGAGQDSLIEAAHRALDRIK